MTRCQKGHSMDNYRILVSSHLDPRRGRDFPGLSMAHLPDGTTRLLGSIRDQSHLHAVLHQIQALNVMLLEVKRLAVEPTTKSPNKDIRRATAAPSPRTGRHAQGGTP